MKCLRLDLEVEYDVTAEMFPGFSTLTKEDRALLQEKLGTSGTKGKKSGKKRKGSAASETKEKQNKKLKEEIKEKTETERKEEEALKVIFTFCLLEITNNENVFNKRHFKCRLEIPGQSEKITLQSPTV